MRLTFGNDPASFYRPDPFLAAQEAAVAAALGTTEARFELVDLDAWQRENAALKAKMGPVPGEFLTAADLPPDVTVSLDGRDYLLLPSENGLTLRDELARTFAALAAETNRLLAVSFVVLVAALAALFRGRFAAHVLPIGAAILATAGALGWSGAPVSFFQLLSFFILAGLGIDYVTLKGDELHMRFAMAADIDLIRVLTAVKEHPAVLTVRGGNPPAIVYYERHKEPETLLRGCVKVMEQVVERFEALAPAEKEEEREQG